jgi:hypothetical protein
MIQHEYTQLQDRVRSGLASHAIMGPMDRHLRPGFQFLTLLPRHDFSPAKDMRECNARLSSVR